MTTINHYTPLLINHILTIKPQIVAGETPGNLPSVSSNDCWKFPNEMTMNHHLILSIFPLFIYPLVN